MWFYILVQGYHWHRLDKQLNIDKIRLNIQRWQQLFIRIWQQVHRRRNRFEIPLLAAILRTKFPKEQTLVHKTTNLCATQNSWHYPKITTCASKERGPPSGCEPESQINKAPHKITISLTSFENFWLAELLSLRLLNIHFQSQSKSSQRDLY